jgi:hypothetical protein
MCKCANVIIGKWKVTKNEVRMTNCRCKMKTLYVRTEL